MVSWHYYSLNLLQNKLTTFESYSSICNAANKTPNQKLEYFVAPKKIPVTHRQLSKLLRNGIAKILQ